MLKNDFFGYPKLKWLQLTGEVDKSVRSSCQIFSWFNVPKLIKSVNFWQNYSKNKEIDVFSGIQRTMYTVSHQPRASNFNKPDFEGIRAGCGPPLGDGPTQSRYSWYVTPVMATPSPSVVLKGILEVERRTRLTKWIGWHTETTLDVTTMLVVMNKKLSYRRGTARCVVSVEILPTATQQRRNYLYEKSLTNRSYEVRR